MTRASYLIPAVLFCVAATAEEPAQADVDAWLNGYEAAWETRDADAAAALFSEDAQYYETPWSEPFIGRQGIGNYWSGVTADQRNVDFSYEIISVNGSIAVARWTAQFELASNGATLALDGVFILEFSARDVVSELREWWVLKP
jgi:uncharacterized protein (TIGR02246 family)